MSLTEENLMFSPSVKCYQKGWKMSETEDQIKITSGKMAIKFNEKV
jgi:hypothetical protein